MCARAINYQDIPTEFQEDSQVLLRINKYVFQHNRQHPSQRMCGTAEDVSFFYWPSIYNDFNATRHIATLVGCTRPPEATRTYLRFLRQHTETLLGSLLVPSDLDHVAFYANNQGYRPTEDPYKPLVNLDNYTCFRKLRLDKSAALRTRIVPPPKGLIARWMDSLPPAIALLHCAWTQLILRSATNLFCGRDVGVDYAGSGRMVVDWNVFLSQASVGVRGKDITPEEVYRELLHRHRPYSLKSGIVSCDHVDYANNVRSAGFDVTKYFTVIDPITLYRKPRLFEGQYYFHIKQQRRQSHLRKTAGQPPTRLTKIYPFLFRPKDYLTGPLDVTVRLEEAQWFLDDHEEEIYAIKYKGDLLFARPNYLSTKNPACVAEVDVWQRALTSLKMAIHLDENGELGLVDVVNKNKYFKTLSENMRQKAMTAFLKYHAHEVRAAKEDGSPELSVRQWRRVMQSFAAEQYKTDPETLASTVRAGHWYNHLVAKAAREFIKASCVRRSAYVKLPLQSVCGTVQFYSPLAVRTFREFAEGSFDLISLKHRGTSLEPLLRGGRGGSNPAPYILAWARFCEKVQQDVKTGRFASGPKTTRWTPEEDFILLQYYRSRPRMTASDWKTLFTQLPERSKPTCMMRMSGCNKLLKKCLTDNRLVHHRFGHQKCTETEAKRVVLLLGCIFAMRRRNKENEINKRASFVKRVFDLTDSRLQATTFPVRYDKLSFAPFLDDPA